MNDSKDKKIWILTNIIIYLFYLYIVVCIPYTHDDWDWGLTIGLEQLKNASLNSRYAGNFFVVIMTRSVLIKNIVMSIVAWGIPYVFSSISKKTYKEKTIYFILYNLFVMLIPVDTWAQTYGWVSGFANYLISLLCIGIYIWICNKYNTSLTDEFTLKDIIYFIFIVIAQLFLENISIYFFTVSCLMFVVSVKRQSNKKKHIMVLIANIIGIIIMFSSSIYGELFEKGEALAELGVSRKFVFEKGDGLLSIVCSIADNFVTYRMINVWQPVKWLVLVILVATFLVILKNKTHITGKFKILMTTELITLAVYLLLLFALTVVNENRTTDIVFGVFYVWFAVFMLLVISIIPVKKIKTLSGFYWISSFFVVTPLAAILEYGPRLYLASYMFIAMTIIEIVLYLFEDVFEGAKKTFVVIVGICVICMFISRSLIYTDIHQTTLDTKAKIQSAMQSNAKEIYIKDYEHKEYLWGEYPATDERINYYKEFHHIPKEVEIIYE